jgi:RNA polymerase sigma-B factor
VSDETLTSDEVDALFHRFSETGARRDRNRLVEAHLGFAHHVARRFANRGVGDDDLEQIALLALVKAVDRFDPELGYAFTTFAGRTIEGEIKRHFRDATWSVRVPRSLQERHLAVRRAVDEMSHELGRSPAVPEVAARLEASVDEVVEALAASAAYRHESLDGPSGEGGTEIHAVASAGSHPPVETEHVDDRVLIERLMDALSERDREIVRLRFFEQLSQSEIAARVGISQMHVSRLLRRSFEAMRDAARGPGGDFGGADLI